MKWPVLAGVVVASGLVGFFGGRKSCQPEVVAVTPPVIRIRDTVEVPPQWMIDLVKRQDEELAKKPRTDTLYLGHETLVQQNFPFPISVRDTSARFWWGERVTSGTKPGDVTVVVTREPRSGKASVLQYRAPGPILSFVADTSPRPRITFGEFVKEKKHHGFLVDAGLVLGGLTTGFVSGSVVGCIGG